MKRLLGLLLLISFMSGCTSSTEHGECIGILDDPKPNLRYDYNGGNILLAIIFSETIVVPLVVVFDDLKCPVGVK